jgi:serine/threonine protein kinase
MYCTVCGAANEAGNSVCTVCEHPIEEDSGKTEDESLLNGRYRILMQVGTGGFGAVYKARDTLAAGQGTDILAIKQVNLRGLTPQEIIEATDGFHREVLLLSKLEHVNLPQIYDSFTDPEHWYLVMDFIGGETLEQYLRNTTSGSSPAKTRSLPLDEVFSIALQLCHVLHYLHTRQLPIIFRDLKPANVMRAPEGNLYLIDFGIARHFKPGQAKDTMPFGSPGYAAPEQYGKAQTTPQSDIYSLGALLHQLLSGEDPAETPFRFAPLRLYGTAGLAELEALIMRMVEMDPGKRPASTAEVKEELRRIVMFRMLRTNDEPRIWRPGQPQDLPAEFPPAPWQTIASGSGQQQQMQPPQAGPSRRKVLVGGVLAGAALVTGIEGLVWLLQSSGSRSKPPAPVLKPVPTQQIMPTHRSFPPNNPPSTKLTRLLNWFIAGMTNLCGLLPGRLTVSLLPRQVTIQCRSGRQRTESVFPFMIFLLYLLWRGHPTAGSLPLLSAVRCRDGIFPLGIAALSSPMLLIPKVPGLWRGHPMGNASL